MQTRSCVRDCKGSGSFHCFLYQNNFSQAERGLDLTSRRHLNHGDCGAPPQSHWSHCSLLSSALALPLSVLTLKSCAPWGHCHKGGQLIPEFCSRRFERLNLTVHIYNPNIQEAEAGAPQSLSPCAKNPKCEKFWRFHLYFCRFSKRKTL